MPIVRVACVLAICLVAFMFVPAPASAETVSLADERLEVQIWPGGTMGSTLFSVTVLIGEEVPLPATLRLPITPGYEILWVGEVLGGDPSLNPERPYTIVSVPSGQALEMTAEESRTIQYEAQGPRLELVDGLTTSSFRWVQSVPVGEVSFAVRLSQAAEVVRLEPDAPGPPVVNSEGERLYTLRPVTLAEGDEYTVTAAFGRGSADAADDRAGSSVPPVLWAILGVALVALLALVALQRRRAPGTPEKP